MFTAEIDRAASYDRQPVDDMPSHFIVKDAPVEMHVYGLDEVDAFCAHFWDAASRVGFDYETNTLNTTWEGIELGGLGLATREVACYLWWQCFESRSYEMPQVVRTKVRKLLYALNKKRLLTVFNLKYELAVTANPKVFGVYLDGLQDCMQYCRTLDVRGGLKEILVNRMKLGEKWTDDIDFWLLHQRVVLSQLAPTASGKPRDEVTALRENGIQGVYDLYDKKKQSFAESNAKAEAENEKIRAYNESIGPDDEPKKLKAVKEGTGLTSRDEKILASIQALMGLQKDFEYDLGEALAAYWIEKAERGDFEALYTELPLKYCSKYCALDSYNTVLLMDNVCEELERRKLTKAADYYNQQMYLGAAMEEHAFFWDDARAEDIKERYQGIMRDGLKRFLLTPRARGVLDLTPKDAIDIQSSLDLIQLKKFFNPDSTNSKETALLSKILVSPKTRLCMLFHEVNSQYLIDAELTKKTMPALSAVMNKLLMSKGTARAEALAKTHDQLQLLLTNKKMRPAEVGLCVRFANYSMESSNAEFIQELGTAIRTYQGCDIDDDSTWTDEFQAIFYYKLYKKVSKIISSFLDGAGGRKNCMVARLTDDGKVIRMHPYTDVPDEQRDGKLIVYEPNFNVNGAKTKRWTAAYHGVPPMSETRRCYVSRFGNGIVVHKDYSQQELRVLAALSGDKNMLQAFIDNKDLHRMVASQIFGCAEEDVTGNQRATAKSANFGLVYLKTEETFAQDYLNGDVEQARRIFAGIFATFPRMKEWMNERLKLLRKHIKATKDRGDWQCIVPIETLWGDPIEHMFSITKKMDVIDAERYFINWVIQSTASNIGALSIARVEEWLKEEAMKSVVNGFTHDALDSDVEGNEFMRFMENVPKIAEKRPLEEFKLPVRLDAEIGVDLGSLVEIKRNKETDAFVTDGRMDSKIEGKTADVARLLERLRMTYPDLQYEKTGEDAKRNSWSDLFSLKGCYYPDMGKEVVTESGRLIIETA